MKRAIDPRQHHIVPIAYLEHFIIPGTNRLFLLDLHTGAIRKQRPTKIMRRRDYYRQPHAPAEKGEFCFEIEIGKRLETQIKPLFKKLIAGGMDISEEELILLIQYLELQRIKVPKQADFAKTLAKQYVENVALSIPEVAVGLVKDHFRVVIKDEFRFNFMHDMIKSQVYFRYFLRMIWSVWTVPDGMHLVTTDNPVTIFNPDFVHLEQSGIARLGCVVLFPLTPRYLLELIHPERERDPGFDPAETVEAALEDHDSVEIRAGKTLPRDKTDAINFVMTVRADRSVVSDDAATLKSISQLLVGPGSDRGNYLR